MTEEIYYASVEICFPKKLYEEFLAIVNQVAADSKGTPTSGWAAPGQRVRGIHNYAFTTYEDRATFILAMTQLSNEVMKPSEDKKSEESLKGIVYVFPHKDGLALAPYRLNDYCRGAPISNSLLKQGLTP